jgi:hypothetical protein
LKDITEFTNTSAVKFSGLSQLLNTIVVAQKGIKPYLDKILRMLYKNLFEFDEKEFIEIVS